MPSTRRRTRTNTGTTQGGQAVGQDIIPGAIYGGGQQQMGTQVRGRKTTARTRHRSTTGSTSAQHFAIPREVLANKNLTQGMTGFVSLLGVLGVWDAAEKAGIRITPQGAYELGLHEFANYMG